MPRVSIIIPAYNARRWLPETLASAFAQEVEGGLEVIVVDDGSQDDTSAYVREAWPACRLERTENRGVSHARNHGTRLAVGELLHYLDADDVLLPGKVARQVRLLTETGADVVYGNWQELAADGAGGYQPGREVRRRWEEVAADAEVAFFTDMWCPTGAYLYRRSFLDKVLPWKEWLPVIQDARFALDCAMAGARWAHDAEVGVLYRKHDAGSVSTRSRLAFLRDCAANAADVRARWAGRPAGHQEALVRVHAALARQAYALDRPLFKTLHAALEEMRPGYLPAGPAHLRLAARLLGYARAEALALALRRLRGRATSPPSPLLA